MKTIEERAKEYAYFNMRDLEIEIDEAISFVENAYKDGAIAEHELLTKWHDLEEEKPEYDKPVLVKLNRVIDGDIYVVARYDIFDEKNRLFRECSGLCRHILDEDIAGWREIHE